MLNVVYVGHRFGFSEMLVHWLSQRADVRGVVWTDSIAWQRTWLTRISFFRQRCKRRGLVKAIDETLFYLFMHAFYWERHQEEIRRMLVWPYFYEHGNIQWRGNQIFTHDLNAASCLSFLRECQPDLILAQCVSTYFSAELREIPRKGVFVWHEGLTPEYRGLYSPFWTLYNGEVHELGYTLLKMNEKLDGGDVYVQGTIVLDDPKTLNFGYIGHSGIVASLPEVDEFLRQLEEGHARPIRRADARPRYYSYPGISDLLRQRWRVRHL
jgi:hypothetical protein